MKYKKIIVIVFCTLLIFAITVGMIWDYSVQLQQTLTNETYKTLSKVSKDYNKVFLDKISYNIKIMQVLAGGLESMHNQTKTQIMYVLQNAVDAGGFTNVVVCDTNGKTCDNDGVSINVSDRDYFQHAMRNEINISEPLTSSVDGKECIIIALPIYNQKNHDIIVGVIFGVYPLATAGEQLLDFTYYSEGYGFIISPNGTIILSSEHTDKLADEKNIFTFFEKTEMINYSVEKIKEIIKNNDIKIGESESFTFNYKGERRFVSFTPSEVNDWYTFSIASDTQMLKQEKATKQIVLSLVLKLTVVGILLLIWLIVSNRLQNKEMVIANQKYQSLLSNINGGMLVAKHATSADKTIATYVSSGFTEMTGYTLEDITNTYGGRYLDVLFEEDRQAAFDIYMKQTQLGNTYHMPYRIRKKDGSIIWIMDNGYLVKDTDGLHNHSIITDITIIKNQEEELRLSESRFSLAINASSGTLFEVDLKNKIYTHFENAERIFGISAEKLLSDTFAFSKFPFDEFVDMTTKYFFHPDDIHLAKIGMDKLIESKTASYEARIRRFDNSYIWVKIDLSLNLDAFKAPSRLIGFMSDIDDIKKQAEILSNEILIDQMTGLYNKVAMATLSKKIIDEFSHERHALIVLDVDNFKGINDTLGHAFGDLVLIEACTKLKALFESKDIVGRVGGDEFAVLMKNIPDTSYVLKKANELAGIFRQTYAGENNEYKISCSMGIIIIDSNAENYEILYRKADAALYQAKQLGKDRFVLYCERDAANYPIKCKRTNNEDLQNLTASNSIESHIFELLYSSKDFNVSINMALAAIGRQYHVSRVAIFENDDDNYFTSNTYEWCNDGISSEIKNLQNVKISLGTESILNSFDQNGLLYCNDVRELPQYLKSILDSKGVLSNLQIIISNDKKICGFIGFDECTDYRAWTSDEIEKLYFISKLLSVFLFKKKAEVTLIENLHTRLKILDILPDYICVVNPETHSIVYSNKKMQEILPDAQIDAFCFNTLRGGQGVPCQTCLIERIKRGDKDNLEIISEDKKIHLKIKALSINWTNNKEMVLLYGAI
ncbi:MAG: diguanylate cyclase [Clostridia bacterium]